MIRSRLVVLAIVNTLVLSPALALAAGDILSPWQRFGLNLRSVFAPEDQKLEIAEKLFKHETAKLETESDPTEKKRSLEQLSKRAEKLQKLADRLDDKLANQPEKKAMLEAKLAANQERIERLITSNETQSSADLKTLEMLNEDFKQRIDPANKALRDQAKKEFEAKKTELEAQREARKRALESSREADKQSAEPRPSSLKDEEDTNEKTADSEIKEKSKSEANRENLDERKVQKEEYQKLLEASKLKREAAKEAVQEAAKEKRRAEQEKRQELKLNKATTPEPSEKPEPSETPKQ